MVIGGGGAIGRACLRAFAAAGANLWSLDLDGAAAAAGLDGLGHGHHHAALDVTDRKAVADRAQAIGACDSIVYAAGLESDGDIVDLDWADYRRVMAVNLDGAFHVAAGFAGAMISARRAGSFVFLASMAGLRGEAGTSVYCASKFGVVGLVESFAAEMTPHAIRINAVCPGNVDSPMLRRITQSVTGRVGGDADELYESWSRYGAAQRMVTPREVADLCLFLASPAATAITGAAVRVDAGAMLYR